MCISAVPLMPAFRAHKTYSLETSIGSAVEENVIT